MFAEAAALTLSTIKLLTFVWADTFTTAHRTLIFATTMYAFLFPGNGCTVVRAFATATVAAVEGCVFVATLPFIATVAAVGDCKNLVAVAGASTTAIEAAVEVCMMRLDAVEGCAEVGTSSTATVVAVEDCKNLRVVVGASGTASNVSTEACEARLETRLQTRLNKRLDLLSRQDLVTANEARPERFKTRLNTRLNTRLDLA